MLSHECVDLPNDSCCLGPIEVLLMRGERDVVGVPRVSQAMVRR